MSIPKIIHYCWFGGSAKPACVRKCLDTWKKFCPDYKIKEWNETNFDYNAFPYTREAYESRRWAFLTDYARLKIIYENGGIYMDTDVELVRSLDSLLTYKGYMGFQDDHLINTGLGFGAEKGHPALKRLMEDYETMPSHEDIKKRVFVTCPEINTKTLISLGLKDDNSFQEAAGITFLPSDYLCPMRYGEKKPVITANTYSIHRFDASWKTPGEKVRSAIRMTVGMERYDRITNKIADLVMHRH